MSGDGEGELLNDKEVKVRVERPASLRERIFEAIEMLNPIEVVVNFTENSRFVIIVESDSAPHTESLVCGVEYFIDLSVHFFGMLFSVYIMNIKIFISKKYRLNQDGVEDRAQERWDSVLRWNRR